MSAPSGGPRQPHRPNPLGLALRRLWWLGRKPPSLGLRGERAAERFLRRRGYRIVAQRQRQFRGELDLVALDGRTIVFVEVKTRRHHRSGHPIESVTQAKRGQLTRLALGFLKRHALLEYDARFDVVAVTWPSDQRNPRIEHFPHAFEPTGKGGMFS
jgi:putative endonuclease